MAWVSFCISTYKRPDFIKKQIGLLLQQAFTDFEIVVSDNDPDASAKESVTSFQDSRVKYFENGTNLGMIKSFNKSIERSTSEFIVMVTDDDPVEVDFLDFFYKLYLKYPHRSAYCGFLQKDVPYLDVRTIEKEHFISHLLDTDKTTEILWSSCVMKKSAVLQIGGFPDYGSPILADHAMIAMVGSIEGAVVVNKMFSHMVLHGGNYSLNSFKHYPEAFDGFYNKLEEHYKGFPEEESDKRAVLKHLEEKFLKDYYALKKYFAVKTKDKANETELENMATKMLSLPFMARFKKDFFFAKSKFALLKKAYQLRNVIVKYK
jgi:glycosyltransferase involved in cell wall biosynthesis